MTGKWSLLPRRRGMPPEFLGSVGSPTATRTRDLLHVNQLGYFFSSDRVRARISRAPRSSRLQSTRLSCHGQKPPRGSRLIAQRHGPNDGDRRRVRGVAGATYPGTACRRRSRLLASLRKSSRYDGHRDAESQRRASEHEELAGTRRILDRPFLRREARRRHEGGLPADGLRVVDVPRLGALILTPPHQPHMRSTLRVVR